jgi:hypothetical protein
LDQSVFVFGWDCPVHQTLAQSRDETNSSWVNGADKSGFIFQICASGAAVRASHPATIKLTHYRAFRLDV